MDRYIITRRGRPVAMMMSIDDYESLLETLDVLSDKRLLRRIKAAEADMGKGRLSSMEEVEKELGLV